MFNFSKIVNKKLSDRIIGKLAPYSISFISCELDWYTLPVIEQTVRQNGFTALDTLFGMLDSQGQTKSDVLVRVFVYNLVDIVTLLLPENQDIVDFETKEEVRNPFIEYAKGIVSKWRGGTMGEKYNITDTKVFFAGDSKIPTVEFSTDVSSGLENTKYFETIFVFSKPYMIVFDLFLRNKDEPLRDKIITDFTKIIKSIKVA